MATAPRLRVLIVFGTRPEAIKLYPLVQRLRDDPAVDLRVCVTAQHRQMLDQVLAIAGIVPDHDLDIMLPNQSLDELTARLLREIGRVLDAEKPDRVVVQGDTATAMVGALAAYYRKIPVSHVEAGLRSGNIHHPWPEEVNRKIIGTIADQHFAPTDTSRDALLAENVPAERVEVTGNTVIDALHTTLEAIERDPSLAAQIDPILAPFAGKRIIAVTTHRRENFGAGLEGMARAVRRIAERPDVAVIFPVHPNPNVRAPMQAVLGGMPNVAMIDPLDYPNFVALLARCHLVLTDSGGVQEEAPALAKPVLVMRETTERPEGVVAGTARLVGSDEETIVAATLELLDDEQAYAAMARAHNPFGDGKSSDRIARTIVNAR
ncbi:MULTISPECIES: non-hydrolyzing UDP-N-acetylglucosamine 2-epimerase [unclassified Sphingomonas]|uniref:non-hydrolyzing UDP-N-acetylglucosamine 2-epimerase n=1 Tax=unclassified Sphingomonas TaxID=196159 RepID=UPI000B11B605|nr:MULTISPECIES: UDP-N-acetylglucosamine 2-epimerase (non-hydrolyzing) [unclassified Sphingomonas]